MLFVCLTATVSACEPRRNGQSTSASPALALIDTVVLAENDSAFIGQPIGLVPVPSAGYLISDIRNGVIHHYGPDGSLIKRIGRRGGGPDEFKFGPGLLVLDADSLLFAGDGNRVKVFNYRTGRALWERTLPGRTPMPLAAMNGGLLFSFIRPDSRSTIGSVQTATDSAARGGPFPDLLGRNRAIAEFFSFLQVARWQGDSIAVAVQSSDFLYIGTLQGRKFDSVGIAVRSRQGARHDLLLNVTDDPKSVYPVIYKPSTPTALIRLSSGNFAYVVSDLEMINQSRFSARMFITVVNPRTGRACPDAEVPAPTDPKALTAFRGDTLLVLSQHIAGTRMTTLIRRYNVSTEGCKWLSFSES